MPRRRRCSCLFVPSKVLVQLGDDRADVRPRVERAHFFAAFLAGGVDFFAAPIWNRVDTDR